MIPRLGEAADRPRSNQAGASRTVKRDGRAAAPGGEMGHGGIGADIDGGTLEQGCQARPVETPAHADYRRVGGPPKAIDVRLLGGLAPFGRDHGEPARRESAGEAAPAGVGPTLVAIERIGMQDGVGRAWGELSGCAILRTDDIRRVVETKRSGKAQELCDPMAIGLGRHRNVMRVPLPPRPVLPACGTSPIRRRAAARAKKVGRSPACVETARSYRRHRLRTKASVSPAEGRVGMDTTWSMSGLPLRMSSVSRNTNMSSVARGNPRRMVRMSGVVSSTSPRRRSVITRMRGRSGSSRLVIVTSRGAERFAHGFARSRDSGTTGLLLKKGATRVYDPSARRARSAPRYLAAGCLGAHVFPSAFAAASAACNIIPPVRPTPKT